jgi:hypothetical protein
VREVEGDCDASCASSSATRASRKSVCCFLRSRETWAATARVTTKGVSEMRGEEDQGRGSLLLRSILACFLACFSAAVLPGARFFAGGCAVSLSRDAGESGGDGARFLERVDAGESICECVESLGPVTSSARALVGRQ